jgi:hypothetical protein
MKAAEIVVALLMAFALVASGMLVERYTTIIIQNRKHIHELRNVQPEEYHPMDTITLPDSTRVVRYFRILNP